MQYLVSWKGIEGLGGKEIEVEADDRWDAVVKASVKLGLDKLVPMQLLFDNAGVRKAGGGKKERKWRFGDVESKGREG